MRDTCAWAWNFCPVIFDHGAVALTLGFLWTLLSLRYFCQFRQSVSVDYPWGIDVHGPEIFDLWPLTLEPWPWHWDCCEPVSEVLMPMWLICACGLPIRVPLTLDLSPWPWHSRGPSCVQCIDASVASQSVEYPRGIDVHEHGTLVLWPLTLEPWPGFGDTCGCCWFHGIDANMASLCLWTIHGGKMCMAMEFLSCDLLTQDGWHGQIG